MDAAYRHLHAALKAAATCITIINDLAYLLLRLPFGSSPALSEFSVVSDVLVDLTTKIANDDTWEPSTLHSDHFDMMNSLPINIKDDSEKFGQADELIMDMVNKDIVFDIYIDDLLAAGVDSPKNRQILLHAVTLALSILFRPLNKNDPLPRDDIVCERKQKAEALLEEVKTVLGWKIDTRTFHVYLPMDKLKHWNLDLEQAIQRKQIHIKTFESIIGRLNHAGFVIPFGKYFLSCLRYQLKCARNRNYRMVYLNKLEIDDLTLWKKLLFHTATIGIDINHITFTKFTITIYSDACEYGIGGYIVNGPAWRFELPLHLQGLFSINLLEFIASKLTIQFAIHWRKDKKIPHQILAFTDSSSALGWLFHSTFDPIKQPMHDKVARDLDWLCTQNNVSLFSQHIPGKRNIIADALSRDFHLNNDELTKILLSHLPSQVHQTFKILNHPNNITLWMSSLLDGETTKVASLKTHKISNLCILTNGEVTPRTLESEMFGFDPSAKLTKTSSCQDLPIKSEQTAMGKFKSRRLSWETLWLPPSILYQQPFEKMNF